MIVIGNYTQEKSFDLICMAISLTSDTSEMCEANVSPPIVWPAAGRKTKTDDFLAKRKNQD